MKPLSSLPSFSSLAVDLGD
uniref:Uncharacterized protein n=1 Tax=Arundo donax TaxID=35708 RepID=A0A0A9SCT3_ARUDO